MNYFILNKIKPKLNNTYSFCVIFVHVNRNTSYDHTRKRLYDLLPHTHYKPSVAKIVQPFLIS